MTDMKDVPNNPVCGDSKRARPSLPQLEIRLLETYYVEYKISSGFGPMHPLIERTETHPLGSLLFALFYI